MANAPRLYLFHGSNSRASLQALHRWETVFLEKYGEATRYTIDADELSLDQVRKECVEKMQGISLFHTPKLLIVKRLDVHEKNKAGGAAIKAMFEQLKGLSDMETTIVCWSDCQLTEKSAIFTWFFEQQALRQAKITGYAVPSEQEVSRVATEYLRQFGKEIARPALTWLVRQYRNQERAQRLFLRLKLADQVVRDDRAWWLYQVLDMASLIENTSEINLETLQWCAEEITPVGVFEIMNAIRDGRWSQAHQLVRSWEITQESSDFFGLWSLLRLQYRKLHDARPSKWALELLAEVEIISKNTQIPYPILTSLLLLRLEEGEKAGGTHPCVAPRRLWLATLPLS